MSITNLPGVNLGHRGMARPAEPPPPPGEQCQASSLFPHRLHLPPPQPLHQPTHHRVKHKACGAGHLHPVRYV
jgi:hypothetical protein